MLMSSYPCQAMVKSINPSIFSEWYNDFPLSVNYAPLIIIMLDDNHITILI